MEDKKTTGFITLDAVVKESIETTMFQQVIKAIRTKRMKEQMTWYDLSKRSGVQQGIIKRFENGEIDIRLGTLVKLYKALNIKSVSFYRK